MKTNRLCVLSMVGCMVFVIAACSQKKKSDDIIAEKIEQPKAQDPVRLQPYTDSRDVQWIGRTYHIAINRQPSDSLPMVKDEIGHHWKCHVGTALCFTAIHSPRKTLTDTLTTTIGIQVFWKAWSLTRLTVTGWNLLPVSVIPRQTSIFL